MDREREKKETLIKGAEISSSWLSDWQGGENEAPSQHSGPPREAR